jgi:transcriptional regulator with XRE-family HTH domain
MEKKTMGSFLTALRKTSGLTQRQLAEKLNVSDKAVSRWERDECAPDLSMIPVLAEIYGVTSDEILRGQRITPGKLDYATDHARAVKQRNRILKSTKTKFTCRSLVTVALSMAGLILAYILNTEFSKANAGFLIGCIFFISAAVCQVLFLITGFTSVNDEDWQDGSTEKCKGFMLLATEWCLGVIAATIALCVPLAGKSSVAFSDCVYSGIQWMFAIEAVMLLISLTFNLCQKRKGSVDLNLPLNKLRLRSGKILALIIVLLLGLQAGLNSFLFTNKHLYGPHDTHTDARLFLKVISEPKTEQGYYMFHDNSIYSENDVWVFYVDDYSDYAYVIDHGIYNQTAYVLHEDEILKELVPTEAEHPDGKRSFSKEYGYQFSHLNRTIPYYEINSTEEVAPIYTFNIEQLAEANRIFVTMNLVYLVTYFIVVAVTLLVYQSKRKKL